MLAPLALGAVVAAALALVLVLGGRESRLTLVLDDAIGLTEGSAVTIGGVPVGEVESVALGRDELPRVEISVAAEVDLRRGLRATVVPGSAAARERRAIALENGNGAPLRRRATLSRAATVTPVEPDAALSTLTPATRRDVRALLARTDRTLAARGPAIDRTLAHSAAALGEAARLTGDVTRDGEALRTVVSDGGRVSEAVAANRAALGGTVEGLAVALEIVAGRRAETGAALERLPDTLRSARSALDRARATTPELRALVRALAPGARELPATAAELAPTLRAARPVLAEGRRLVASAPADLVALDALVRDTRPTVAPLRKVLEQTGPMLDQARVRTPDTTAAITNFADASSNYDANGHGVRIALIFAEPPRRRIGPSEARAGRLSAPFTRTPGVLEGEPWFDFRSSSVAGRGE